MSDGFLCHVMESSQHVLAREKNGEDQMILQLCMASAMDATTTMILCYRSIYAIKSEQNRLSALGVKIQWDKVHIL